MNQESTGFLETNKDMIVICGLIGLVMAIYFQVTRFDFINLDDNLYVYENRFIRNGLNFEAIKWAVTAYWPASWHPLTWISHGLDVHIFGMSPGRHHLVNVILHLANSLMAFFVFRKLTGCYWESAFIAALFAGHPAHVESVAWIAERKDVLSTLFWLLTMWAYARYLRSDDRSFGSREYLIMTGLFALGLMSKAMLVTLPFVLLLLDYWPLGRLRSKVDLRPLIVEKIPLLAMSGVVSVITFLAQKSQGAVESLEYLPLGERLVNAVVSYAKYLVMLLYPADLAVWYPYNRSLPIWQVAGSGLLLAAVTALCVWQMRRRPYLIVGWLWFLGTLVPVIGIVQVGSQAMADRYTYVPYFGLFIMLVFGASDLVGVQYRKSVAAAGVFVVLVLAGIAGWQTSFWQNNETLYEHTLAVTDENYLISHNLCHYLVTRDRLDEAEQHCRDALAIKNDFFMGHNTLGIVQFRRRQLAEAEKSFMRSLELSPRYSLTYANLAQSQSQQGRAEDAEESLRLAVEGSGGAADPIFAPALMDIAAAYEAKQNYEKSAENLRRAVYVDSQNADAHARLARSLYFLKRFDESQIEVQSALSLNQNIALAWNTAGLLMLEQKNSAEAAKAFERALRLDPSFTEAARNLEITKGELR